MTAWLISLSGVAVLGVIVTHLSAGTRMAKTVKLAFTYTFLLTLVFPLPSLFEYKTDCNNVFNFEIEYDEDIIDGVDKTYFEIVSTSLDEVLRERGYSSKTQIDGTVSGEKAEVFSVIVTVSGEFYDGNLIKTEIQTIVVEYLGIEKSKVSVKIE